jgi:hypothetical protein
MSLLELMQSILELEAIMSEEDDMDMSLRATKAARFRR